MSSPIEDAFFAHETLKIKYREAQADLEKVWTPRIREANSTLLNLVAEEGRKLAKFQRCDILVSPRNDMWVVLYVSGKAAQLPNLAVKVIPEYELQRFQKSGSLGKTVEKFAGEALKGWSKCGTMPNEKIEAFWATHRQGQKDRAR